MPHTHAAVLGGRVHQLFAADPGLPAGIRVVPVSAYPDVAEGWLVDADGACQAPVVAPPGPADLLARAAARRHAAETGGLTLNGARIATDAQSQSKIANAYLLLQASGAGSVEFKAENGFVTLTAEQFRTLALAVGRHVQACFAAEAAVDAAVSADPPTIATLAEVDAAFADLAATA